MISLMRNKRRQMKNVAHSVNFKHIPLSDEVIQEEAKEESVNSSSDNKIRMMHKSRGKLSDSMISDKDDQSMQKFGDFDDMDD